MGGKTEGKRRGIFSTYNVRMCILQFLATNLYFMGELVLNMQQGALNKGQNMCTITVLLTSL